MEELLKYLTEHRISVMAVNLPDHGVHAATIHYAHSDTPFKLFFSTERSSRKCQGLLDGKSTSASVVVGFSEDEWITVQMDGEIKAVLEETELKNAKSIYYAKYPSSKKYENKPENIFLEFVPTWWRYSDYNPEPPMIKTSN
ncbi:MAG: hypothetical protein JWO40_18 [Candidatus Doudnabacteria bacterium]|nr:hypothetical protein [Candidatus Doudnabacteria bacterium]